MSCGEIGCIGLVALFIIGGIISAYFDFQSEKTGKCPHCGAVGSAEKRRFVFAKDRWYCKRCGKDISLEQWKYHNPY